MPIKKTFSITLQNNASMMPIYGGEYEEATINYDPSTLIGKITKKYVEAVFGEPFNWLIDLIMEHLL
jgi:hypothetical protein